MLECDKEKCNVSLREYKSFLCPTLMVGFYAKPERPVVFPLAVSTFAINQQPDQQTTPPQAQQTSIRLAHPMRAASKAASWHINPLAIFEQLIGLVRCFPACT